MTNQPIQPLSKNDFLHKCDSYECDASAELLRIKDRLKELFAQLKKEKGTILQFNGKHIDNAVLWCDIEELFAPLMPKEEKKDD